MPRLSSKANVHTQKPFIKGTVKIPLVRFLRLPRFDMILRDWLVLEPDNTPIQTAKEIIILFIFKLACFYIFVYHFSHN